MTNGLLPVLYIQEIEERQNARGIYIKSNSDSAFRNAVNPLKVKREATNKRVPLAHPIPNVIRWPKNEVAL